MNSKATVAWLACTILFLGATFRPQFAEAQETGVRAGAFILRPQIAMTGNYSDNVFLDDSDEKEDYVGIVTGALDIESNWSRHALVLSASTDFVRFLENPDENTEQYRGRADARIDIRRGSTLAITGSFDRLAERRDNSENVANITEIDQYQSAATIDHKPNKLGLRLRGSFLRRDFEDIQEEDRNRNDYGLLTRISYETAPNFAVFGQPFLTVHDFDNLEKDGTNQDSFVYGALFGTELDLRGTLTGEISIGAFHEEFDDAQRDSFSGLAVDTTLTWRPSRLTSITGELARRTQTTQEDGASSKVRTQARVAIRHELKRNLNLTVVGNYSREDFEGTSRVDDTYLGNVGVDFTVTGRLSVFGGYQYRQRDSNAASGSYRNHTARLGFRASF